MRYYCCTNIFTTRNIMENPIEFDPYDVRVDFLHFIEFLKKNNIITTAIVAVLADRINDLSNAFINAFVMPIINRDADGDGVRDIKNIEDKVFKISGMTFRIGEFLVSGIRFFLVCYTVYVVYRFIMKP